MILWKGHNRKYQEMGGYFYAFRDQIVTKMTRGATDSKADRGDNAGVGRHNHTLLDLLSK
jgi:hypothetical protein